MTLREWSSTGLESPGSEAPRPDAPGRRGDRRRPSGSRWPVTGALALLLLVGMTALGPVLQGTGWWWLMAVEGGVVLSVAAGIRSFGSPPWAVALAGIGAVVGSVTLLFGGGTGLLWLVPTGETVERFRTLVESGIASVQTQGTPADPVTGILFLLCVGAGVIAVLMDTLGITLQVPALAGLPVLVPVGVPGLILGTGAEKPTLVLTAAAFLLLLWVDVRGRRGRDAALMGGTAVAGGMAGTGRQGRLGPLAGAFLVGGLGIVLALVLSVAVPNLPGDGRVGGRATGPLLFGDGVSAMVNLGQDLRSSQSGAALHYRTSAAQPPYLKLLTLDRFVGPSWTARVDPVNTGNTVDAIDRPPGLAARVVTTEESTSIVIDGVASAWLPTPGAATKVAGLIGAWYWNGPAGTISSTNSSTRGQQYSVTSLSIAPTPEQLRASTGRYPVSVESSLTLPRNSPTIIEQTARAVTAGATTPYDDAVALQNYLRGSAFTYDTQAPVADGYDGGGVDVVGTFLEVKRGYCVHFASAMAVMARSLGIPARIAIGYLPGSRSSDFIEGRDRFNVDAHDLHAWPELYFTGIGWLPFEPTPGRGTVPSYTQPAGAFTPLEAPVPGVSSAAPRAVDPAGQSPAAANDAATATRDDAGTPGRVSLILGALVMFAGVPGGIRLLRRSRRRRDLARGTAGGAEAWRELVDTAVDFGVGVRETETARELAGRIGVLPGFAGAGAVAAGASLDRLLAAAERHRYGRPGAGPPEPELLGDLDRVSGTISMGATPRTRWRARLLPASLWHATSERGARTVMDA
jgi:transglutaminase-like putative cysteine protease